MKYRILLIALIALGGVFAIPAVRSSAQVYYVREIIYRVVDNGTVPPAASRINRYDPLSRVSRPTTTSVAPSRIPTAARMLPDERSSGDRRDYPTWEEVYGNRTNPNCNYNGEDVCGNSGRYYPTWEQVYGQSGGRGSTYPSDYYYDYPAYNYGYGDVLYEEEYYGDPYYDPYYTDEYYCDYECY